MRTEMSVPIRIAITEDEEDMCRKVRNIVSRMLKERSIAFEIHSYSAVSDILYDMECGILFQIYLLDIEFGKNEKNGMFLARRIRFLQPQANIIFISSFVEKYAPEGYLVQAFRFIPKDYLVQMLPEAIDSLVEQFNNENAQQYAICREKEYYSFDVKDIVYIENVGKNCIFYLSKEYSTMIFERISLKKIMDKLPREEFIRIDKPYCINTAHVIGLDLHHVMMDNGDMLSISRNGRRILKKVMMRRFRVSYDKEG